MLTAISSTLSDPMSSPTGAETLARVNEIPPEDRVIGNEEWNDFLLHDNTGAIRKSLWPFFPNGRANIRVESAMKNEARW